MNGFSMFDSIHITWLILIAMLLTISIYCYRSFSSQQQQHFQRAIFWLLLALEITKQIFLALTNHYSYWSPPLHLCGLGIFVTGWHAYFPNKTTSTLLFSLTLPGAMIALLFPGWTNNPVGSFLHIHSFVFHALLILFICPLIREKQLTTSFKDLWRSILFLIITVPPIYMYNKQFHTNFMFLNAPVKGTPLQWLYDAFGASGYLISLAIVILIIWIILYIPSLRKKGER
jgi:uncharacterized membrane protein YwaF